LSEREKRYATVNWIGVDGFVYYVCDDPEVIAATQPRSGTLLPVRASEYADKVFAMCNSDFGPVTLSEAVT
jgi:hypothetical protein